MCFLSALVSSSILSMMLIKLGSVMYFCFSRNLSYSLSVMVTVLLIPPSFSYVWSSDLSSVMLLLVVLRPVGYYLVHESVCDCLFGVHELVPLHVVF